MFVTADFVVVVVVGILDGYDERKTFKKHRQFVRAAVHSNRPCTIFTSNAEAAGCLNIYIAISFA